MSRTQTATEEEEKKKPQVDLYPRWSLERKCFESAKIRDVKTGKEHSWPYTSTDPVSENKYSVFLDKVTDPDTGYFFPKRETQRVNPLRQRQTTCQSI